MEPNITNMNNQGKFPNQIEDSYKLVAVALLGLAVVTAGMIFYEVYSSTLKFMFFKLV